MRGVRILPLNLPSGRVYLGEVCAEDELLFRYLMSELLERQAELDNDPYLFFPDPDIQVLISSLCGLVPLLPLRRGLFLDAAPLLQEPLNIQLLSTLFWGEDCHLLQLNAPDPIEEVDEDEELTPEKVPIESSGDVMADLIARIIGVDGTVHGAERLMQTYSARTLGNITQQLNELRRDPKERLADYQAKMLEETLDNWELNDPELYLRAIGKRTGEQDDRTEVTGSD